MDPSLKQAILGLMPGSGDGQRQYVDWRAQATDNGPQQPSFPVPTAGNGDTAQDETLALLLPLLLLLLALLLLLILFALFLLFFRKRQRVILRDEGGPTDVGSEQLALLTAEGGLDGVEGRWLEGQDEATRQRYQRAKVWQQQYPPNSLPTDITLSQFLSIQEKGVSAWAFEPDYESNPAVIVQSRTELGFLPDAGIDGACCVQSNLPLPKLNEVYYWEAKMYELPRDTTVAVGLATKPFPSFRMPGWNKHSVGYFSEDGFKSTAYPFLSSSYGPPLTEGDVLGVGYRPRSGTVFFTRNGKRLPDAFTGLGYGLSAGNVFPTVAADGAAAVHVNLGQAGFVFIEANVKKWGLAPMLGTLAPPPAYGAERGSILLEAAEGSGTRSEAADSERRRFEAEARGGAGPSSRPQSSRTGSSTRRSSAQLSVNPQSAASALSTAPARPSPLRHSRQPSNSLSPVVSGSNSPRRIANSSGETDARDDEDDDQPQNPPTPGLLDISLHSLHRFPARPDASDDEDDEYAHGGGETDESSSGASDDPSDDELPRASGSRAAYVRPPISPESAARHARHAQQQQQHQTQTQIEPPAYFPVDPHRYAPGVAEAMIDEAFANIQAHVGSSSSSSRHAFPGMHTQMPQPSRRGSSRGAGVPSQQAQGGAGSAGGWFSSWFTPAAQREDSPGQVEAGTRAAGSS